MATPSKPRALEGELMSPPDLTERQAQAEAGRLMAMNPDPEPAPVPEYDPDPDDIALQNVIAELGSTSNDAKVNVYQLDPRTKSRAFVGAYVPSEFSLERLQAEFGPGDYEIRVYNTVGLKTRRNIRIAAPKVAANIPSPIVPPTNETQKILESMNAGFQAMGQMFAQALGQLAQNQPKPKSTLETLQEMQMMKEIFGANNTAPSVPDPMELFRMATEISEKIHPREGEPGTGEIILKAIENFGPALSQAMQHNAPQIPPQIPQQSAPPNQVAPFVPPNQSAPNISPNPAAPIETDNMNFARRMYLNMLVSNAAANNDPATYANLLLDVAGEEVALQFANRPDWFAALCEEEPRAANYPEWFGELRQMVLDLTAAENPAINEGTMTSPAPLPST